MSRRMPPGGLLAGQTRPASPGHGALKSPGCSRAHSTTQQPTLLASAKGPPTTSLTPRRFIKQLHAVIKSLEAHVEQLPGEVAASLAELGGLVREAAHTHSTAAAGKLHYFLVEDVQLERLQTAAATLEAQVSLLARLSASSTASPQVQADLAAAAAALGASSCALPANQLQLIEEFRALTLQLDPAADVPDGTQKEAEQVVRDVVKEVHGPFFNAEILDRELAHLERAAAELAAGTLVGSRGGSSAACIKLLAATLITLDDDDAGRGDDDLDGLDPLADPFSLPAFAPFMRVVEPAALAASASGARPPGAPKAAAKSLTIQVSGDGCSSSLSSPIGAGYPPASGWGCGSGACSPSPLASPSRSGSRQGHSLGLGRVMSGQLSDDVLMSAQAQHLAQAQQHLQQVVALQQLKAEAGPRCPTPPAAAQPAAATVGRPQHQQHAQPAAAPAEPPPDAATAEAAEAAAASCPGNREGPGLAPTRLLEEFMAASMQGGSRDARRAATFHAQMRLPREGVERLAAFLEASKRVRGLSLAHNGIGPEACQRLVAAMAVHRSVRSLDLPDNRLGNAGAACIASLLRTGLRLTSLHLASNDIGDEGATAIAQALGFCPSLERLSLFNNRIGVAGCAALVVAAQASPSLKVVEFLPGNAAPARDVQRLARAVKANRALQLKRLFLGACAP